ncbi:winged helix-turn-helix domain-containing protein [Caulobacter sp. 1776]|uniref:winged helix-turn-helix domain-containing protein n=1 Tax=Caulobacter sp. 1776 TaxID=3156420 RepID=UPI003399026D
MASGGFHFERFNLDLADRQLTRDGVPVTLNARYFDALALLVREHGKLITKDRFLDEVWGGVPVTDEALTQCVRTLRKALGDDASAPRFIQTAPKHGYRFIAPIVGIEAPAEAAAARAPSPSNHPAWRGTLLLGTAGTLGAGLAGGLGGLFYGLVGAAQPGASAVSALLVLLCLTVAIALVGGAGVAFGIATGEALPGRSSWWRGPLGGAIGGLLVGAMFKLLGLDALTLLFGRAPGGITGGLEGAALGAAVGLGAGLARRASGGFPYRIALAGLVGGIAGLVIPLLGGRLLGGSLDLLAHSFPDSRLRLVGVFGEHGFGPITQALTGALEGALFSAGLVGGLQAARRWAGEVTARET